MEKEKLNESLLNCNKMKLDINSLNEKIQKEKENYNQLLLSNYNKIKDENTRFKEKSREREQNYRELKPKTISIQMIK